jgi:hypothetical protein
MPFTVNTDTKFNLIHVKGKGRQGYTFAIIKKEGLSILNDEIAFGWIAMTKWDRKRAVNLLVKDFNSGNHHRFVTYDTAHFFNMFLDEALQFPTNHNFRLNQSMTPLDKFKHVCYGLEHTASSYIDSSNSKFLKLDIILKQHKQLQNSFAYKYKDSIHGIQFRNPHRAKLKSNPQELHHENSQL